MGNCLFLRARGWEIDRQMRTKLQIPGGMPGGDTVTGRIEPCITVRAVSLDLTFTQLSLVPRRSLLAHSTWREIS